MSTSHRRLRFAVVNEILPDRRGWLDHIRRIEQSGVDTVLIRDHIAAGPFEPQLAPRQWQQQRQRTPPGCGWEPWCSATTTCTRRSSRMKQQRSTGCQAAGSNSASAPAGCAASTTRWAFLLTLRDAHRPAGGSRPSHRCPPGGRDRHPARHPLHHRLASPTDHADPAAAPAAGDRRRRAEDARPRRPPCRHRRHPARAHPR